MLLKAELTLAKALAQEAGALALSLRANLQISEKPDEEGPVTNADKACDELICAGILSHFPHDEIISEESYTPGQTAKHQGRMWFVDPIDGTADYIEGGDDFAIMIGLVVDGEARLGVIYQPTTGKLWHGIVTGEKIRTKHVSVVRPFKDLRVAVSKHHPSGLVMRILQDLGIHHQVQQGSFGLKMMLVVDDKADFYIVTSRHIKFWDSCAPLAIIRAHGLCAESFRLPSLHYHAGISHEGPLLMASRELVAQLRTPLWERYMALKKTS